MTRKDTRRPRTDTNETAQAKLTSTTTHCQARDGVARANRSPRAPPCALVGRHGSGCRAPQSVHDLVERGVGWALVGDTSTRQVAG